MTHPVDLCWKDFGDRVSKAAFAASKTLDRALLIGIDGPDCSGKSTFSRIMVRNLKSRCKVVPLHFDDFFNGANQAQRSDKPPAQFFREDYFDWNALNTVLSELLESGFGRDCPTIVIVEGLFLFERERRSTFDILVRLEAHPELIISRALKRDVGVLGTHDRVRRHYDEECIPAQQAYISDVQPGISAHFHAEVVGESGNVRVIRDLSQSTSD